MIFLSTLLRQGIYDNEKRRVGTIDDVCVSLEETFPIVTALVVHTSLGSGETLIPWSLVFSIEEPQVHLTIAQNQLQTYTPQSDEIFLKRDILDKQIVDTQG